MRLFIYIFIIFSLAASCNVERRLHNPGWHVEWKHRIPSKSDNRKPAEYETTKSIKTTDYSELTTASLHTTDTVLNTDSHIISDAIPVDIPSEGILRTPNSHPLKSHIITPVSKQVKALFQKKIPQIKQDPGTEKPVSQHNPYTRAKWILNFIALGLLILVCILIFTQPEWMVLLMLLLLFLPFIILFMILLNVLFSIKARKVSQENPTRYE